MEDADYQRISSKLKQNGVLNVKLDPFTQTSLDRKKLEEKEKATENRVVRSARLRLENDKAF